MEFVVLEGACKDARFTLEGRRIVLGRRDVNMPDPGGERIGFPEPTVSGAHAVLDWDAKKSRYLLTHISKTNHTLVNKKIVAQPIHIHVGDRIKMGALLIQLCKFPGKADPKAEIGGAMPLAVPSLFAPPRPPERPPTPGAAFKILVLNGPDAATLHSLSNETQVIQEPGGASSHDPVFSIRGIGHTRAVLLWKPPNIHVTCADSGDRPILIDHPLPGVIRQRLPGPEFGNLLTDSSLLLCGRVAMVAVDGADADQTRDKLLAGEWVSNLQTGLFHEGDRIWNRGEQHLLRFVAGPLKGMLLWLEPRRYESPIRIGRLGQQALVELTDRGAASVEVRYKDDSFWLLNTDQEVGLGLNWQELSPNQEARLICGDRFRLGRTLVRYEYLPIQSKIENYSILFNHKEIPLQREENLLGSSPLCDVRLEDNRVGPQHGKIIIGEGSLRYQHRQGGTVARCGDKELRAGEEVNLRLDSVVQVCEGVEIRVARRSSSLGADAGASAPTLEQIQEAQRGLL